MLNKKLLVKKYAEKHRYFFLYDAARELGLDKELVMNYCYQLKKENLIFGAGRGWYSNFARSFELDTEPVQEMVDSIKKKFPLLKFSCWSTRQINRFTHHMLGKYVTLVYMDWDALPVVYDFLKDAGHDVWLNPRGKEAERFAVRENTVVLRPAISREPRNGYYAAIEKIMVDLFIEGESLYLMSEYDIVRKNILEDGRIDVAALLAYAKRRKVPSKAVFKE
ncbi:MAG: hypothetical protein KC684_08835 [Candidatus Omnitrophica bacterium]|nr:hypothetical protein [Candidatus Omnitrophota bacterium]